MALRADLQVRLMECGLEMHPVKSKIVYCKDSNRRSEYPNVSFDFLGYRFQPRRAENTRSKQVFCNFLPAVSPSALKSMRSAIREFDIRQRTQVSLADIAREINPLLRGWIAAEMALSVLAYNLTRAMNILGIRPLIDAIAA
ncbi:hypothetical protein NLM33_34685 [Bradyrhizobium sp. CCGUVB1N3]|uniref:group II intron maturase-specific domain-containing protein n=1 Tax=Bradyrhizobium sp. CCGUVB1N3 TaxID=2949629 RepID=UPI0020B307F9|nr:group II intron maturase-specific domain-containing protein [Bradyrhizobium sp. CCGUVB1N3]MCP3475462.1 hypothetical protein [Bradyrhizobium sp. CCGUVB1N3]